LVHQALATALHMNSQIVAIQRFDTAELDPALQRQTVTRNTHVVTRTRRSEKARRVLDKSMGLGSEDGRHQIARSRINGQYQHELALALTGHVIEVITVITPNLPGDSRHLAHQAPALIRAASKADWYIAC